MGLMKKFDSQRALAKALFEHGTTSPLLISKHCNIAESTAREYVKKLKRGESLADRPRSGRPLKLTPTLRRQLGQVKSRYPHATAKFYAEYLSKLNGVNISVTYGAESAALTGLPLARSTHSKSHLLSKGETPRIR